MIANSTCVYAVQVQKKMINGYNFQSMAYTQCYAAKRTVKIMRENGYYWVLDGDRWRVAKYEKGYGWQICGDNEYYEDDNHWKEIDERQIVREA